MVNINLPGLVTLVRENNFVRIFLEIKLYRPVAMDPNITPGRRKPPKKPQVLIVRFSSRE